MSTTFNTHEFIKTLEEAGIPENQAEAHVKAYQRAQEQAELATQPELRLELQAIKHELKESELRLEAKIHESKVAMIMWIAAMLLAQAGLVAALVKLL